MTSEAFENWRGTFCKSIEVRIYVAGDHAKAQEICREFCSKNGACFFIKPGEYIYTGGQESGVEVTLINYPRFPKASHALENTARELGMRLIEGLHQNSGTIVGPNGTTWLSRKKV